MKKLLCSLTILALTFSLSGCGSKPASTDTNNATPNTVAEGSSNGGSYDNLEPIELTYGNSAALGAAGDLWGNLFCEKVAAETGGKLKVNYFGNSQLGVDSELQQQLLAGDIHIVSAQTAQTTSFVPEVSVFDLPLVFAKYNTETINKALNESPFTDKINEGYAKANMINLGFLQGGTYREMTSNKKIESVDDFAGIKIRTMDSKYHMAFWSALGANPTPLPFTELYMSLQQGVVAAQENATDTCVTSKFYEVQKYLVETHHILYMNQFLMNKTFFDSLDPAYQNAIRKAVAEATAELAPKLKQIDEDNKAKLLENNMELCSFDDAFYDELVKKAEPVYTQIRNDISGDLVDSLIQELANAK